jgi:hypothetical protein
MHRATMAGIAGMLFKACMVTTTAAFLVSSGPRVHERSSSRCTTHLRAAAPIAPAGSFAASLEALHDATITTLTEALKVRASVILPPVTRR